MQDTWVRSLGREDPLEEAMETTQCDILAWRIPGKRSLAGYSPWGRRVGHNLATKLPNLKICFYYIDSNLILRVGFFFFFLGG